MNITGTAADDTKQGTVDSDSFDMTQGGVDTVNGNLGDDLINFGATLTAADKVSGGDGYDTLFLVGDYSGGLTFNSTTVRFVEKLELLSGHTYDITVSNNTVAAGAMLDVGAYGVGFGNTGDFVRFDGSAETNGGFFVYDSYGNDTIIGGQVYDNISIGYGGADHIDAQGGDDIIGIGNQFGAGDVIDGGAGNDLAYFGGVQAGTLFLTGANFKNIESVAMADGVSNLSLFLDDGVVNAGTVFNFDGRGMQAGYTIYISGSQEIDGTFDFYDGASNDTFVGGAGADLFRAGGGGADFFSGLGGDDTFGMQGSLDAGDTIYGGSGYDTVDLQGDYSAGVHFADDGLAGVERFTLRGGDFTYKLFFADGNLNTAESIAIDSADLGVGHFYHIDASAETAASYSMGDSSGNDTLIGGGGNDTFWITRGGSDKVTGGGGADYFIVDGPVAGTDKFNGGTGTDTVSLYYVDGASVINFATGKYSVGGVEAGTVTQIENGVGSAFDDTLIGNSAANAFNGGLGADTISGGQDNDWLLGEGGADIVNGDAGEDALDGGEGNDTLDGGTQNDSLVGGIGVDILTGGAGNDHIDGGTQNDQLFGGLNLDTLLGGDGHDLLDGGAGNDSLTGGVGRDTFVFATGTGVDTVTDFLNNQDYLDFQGSVANSFADIQANMAQVGADVVIAFGTDKFILTGVNLGLIDAGDFLF